MLHCTPWTVPSFYFVTVSEAYELLFVPVISMNYAEQGIS